MTQSPDDLSAGVADLREQSLVLPEHDVPAVAAPDVVATVPAHRGAQALVADEELHRLDELVAIGIPEAAVAAGAMLDQDRASRVDQNRRADRERLEREQRQTLVRRRTDDDRGGFERLEAFAVRQQTRELDVRLFGQRQ